MTTGVVDASAAAAKKRRPVVRLGKAVENYLKKRGRTGETTQDTLRRILGLPDRRGRKQDLRRYYVIPNGDQPLIRLSLAEARGEAILIATRKRLKKAEAVIEVQECG